MSLIIFATLFNRKFILLHVAALPVFLTEIFLQFLWDLEVLRIFQCYFYIFWIVALASGKTLFKVSCKQLRLSFCIVSVLFFLRMLDISFFKTSLTAIFNENSLALNFLMHIFLLQKSKFIVAFGAISTFVLSSKAAFASSFVWLVYKSGFKMYNLIMVLPIAILLLYFLSPTVNVVFELLSDVSRGNYLSGRTELWSHLFENFVYPINWNIFNGTQYSNPENFFMTFILTIPVFGVVLIWYFIIWCLDSPAKVLLLLFPCLVYPFILPLFLATLSTVKAKENEI